MLFLRYLLLFTGWGLLAAAAINVFKNLTRLSSITASCDLWLQAPYPDFHRDRKAPPRNRHQPVALSRKTATELDHCNMGVSCGLAAAHPRCRHSGGAQRDGWHQSEPDRGDTPRNLVSGRSFSFHQCDQRFRRCLTDCHLRCFPVKLETTVSFHPW
jgi:hypothetical protein